MNEFRESRLDELYGPSRIDNPILPGEINWKQVAIYGGIIVITGVTIGLCVHVAMAKRNEQFLAELRNNPRPVSSMAKVRHNVTHT
jgi:hypothetical protein